MKHVAALLPGVLSPSRCCSAPSPMCFRRRVLCSSPWLSRSSARRFSPRCCTRVLVLRVVPIKQPTVSKPSFGALAPRCSLPAGGGLPALQFCGVRARTPWRGGRVCTVIVTLTPGETLQVAVEDDGIDPLTRSMGNGMLYMRERALKAGAQLQVEALTPGTRVSATFSPRAFTA